MDERRLMAARTCRAESGAGASRRPRLVLALVERSRGIRPPARMRSLSVAPLIGAARSECALI